MDDLQDEEILNLDCSNIPVDEEEEDINSYDKLSELSDRDLYLDDTELVENEKCNLSLNNKYRMALEELRREIILELQRCKEKKAIIESRIQELSTSCMKLPSRKNWYNLFGFPYFKDRHFFPCPINEDAKEKRSKNEIDYHLVQPIRKWVPSDCEKLDEAVKANAIEMKTSELVKIQGNILQKLRDPLTSTAEKKKLPSELKAINSQIQCVKNMSSIELFGDINKSFDWLKITAEAFGELRCSEEVRAMWILCRHPTINKKHWTVSESRALKEIALRNKEQDWERIALELNTKRSEFQCVIQYQRHVNEALLNHKWTDEEDEMLRRVISKCRVGDSIPWTTVSMCMTNRSRTQVYNRWQYSLNPDIRRGRFTAEEDCLIMAGVKRFGKDFSRISEILPGRTTTQIYARYTQCLVRIGPLGRWTKEEDALLLKFVEEEGCNKWHKLTKYFNGRNRNQVRHRYLFLKDWRARNPRLAVEEAPRRNVGDCSERNSKLWCKIQKILKPNEDIPKKDCDALNDEDLAVLKTTLSKRINRTKPVVKRTKPYSVADKLLDEFARVGYRLASGRKKALFNEEDKQQRFDIMIRLLTALQACLTFSFDDSVIEEDELWNDGDKHVLYELKKKIEVINQRKVTITEQDSSAGNSSSLPNAVSAVRPETLNNFPLYVCGATYSFHELFPANFSTLVGFRTLLLSRSNLRVWKNIPPPKVVAIPSQRAPKGEEKQSLSHNESRKLFSERMHTLFKWSCQLANNEPSLCTDTYGTEEEKPEKPTRKRRRTLQRAAVARKRAMKKKWTEMKEAKSNDQRNGSKP